MDKNILRSNDLKFFIIDFDSTFITLEGLDVLASISLKKTPEKIALIEQITRDGMVGKIGFRESLELRIKELGASVKDLEQSVKVLKRNISPSILRNKKFFKQNRDQIYIISGGFEEMILSIVGDFGILPDHVLANKFLIKNGEINGFDKTRPTSEAQGKARAVRELGLKGEVIVVGDGFTDLEIKRLGAASKFAAYTENVSRESIIKDADVVVRDFDELLFLEKISSEVSYPKSRMKVLLLENIEKAAEDNFKKEGYQVETLKTALDEKELIERIKNISILGIRSKTKISQNVLNNARKLKTIGTFSIGTDQVDLGAALQSGVSVFNAPYQNTRSVVELAIGEIIALSRGIFDKSVKAHKGIWDKSAKGSNEIRGKVLGIIGYGSIGSQLSVLAESLGMEVLFYDKIEKLALGNARKAVSMEEVFKKSDIISVHVSGDSKTNTNLITEKHFNLMKDGVIFLNLARGFVVDVEALVRSIKSGKIRGAGVDVFPNEPKGKDDPLVTELAGLPNVILTPHIAGSTEEAQRNIAQFVSGKLIDFMNSGNTYLSVNFPNINLAEQGKAHRLLHLHKNEPGILSEVNKVLAKSGANILEQYLKTNEEVGYVITDIDKKYKLGVIEELKKIKGTISLRVLY
jgi:D-3-phosphoglycerate dehydrogenase